MVQHSFVDFTEIPLQDVLTHGGFYFEGRVTEKRGWASSGPGSDRRRRWGLRSHGNPSGLWSYIPAVEQGVLRRARTARRDPEDSIRRKVDLRAVQYAPLGVGSRMRIRGGMAALGGRRKRGYIPIEQFVVVRPSIPLESGGFQGNNAHTCARLAVMVFSCFVSFLKAKWSFVCFNGMEMAWHGIKLPPLKETEPKAASGKEMEGESRRGKESCFCLSRGSITSTLPTYICIGALRSESEEFGSEPQGREIGSSSYFSSSPGIGTCCLLPWSLLPMELVFPASFITYLPTDLPTVQVQIYLSALVSRRLPFRPLTEKTICTEKEENEGGGTDKKIDGQTEGREGEQIRKRRSVVCSHSRLYDTRK